jgi:hypothetical protein
LILALYSPPLRCPIDYSPAPLILFTLKIIIVDRIIVIGSSSSIIIIMSETKPQEDQTMEPEDEGGSLLLQTALMGLFVLVGVCVLGFLWIVTSRRGRPRRSGLMVQPPATEEELEARKQFVDKNLPVEKFKKKNNMGRRDFEEGKNDESTEDLETPKVGEGDDVCPICLNEYTEGDDISWSTNRACEHIFHKDCVHAWLLKHHLCPMCRSLFVPEDGESEEHGTAPVVDSSNVTSAAASVDDHDEERNFPA